MKNVTKVFLAMTCFATCAQSYAAIPAPPKDKKPAFVLPAVSESGPISPVSIPTGRPTSDQNNSNTPPDRWYTDMHQQLYDLQQNAYKIKEKNYAPEVNYYADWLAIIIDAYYASAYDENAKPKKYDFGKPTRGDFNHFFYYYVRPVYKQVLYYSSDYYRNLEPSYYEGYASSVKPFYESYHKLARCNYGRNSNDMMAEDDTELQKLEESAGVLWEK